MFACVCVCIDNGRTETHQAIRYALLVPFCFAEILECEMYKFQKHSNAKSYTSAYD